MSWRRWALRLLGVTVFSLAPAAPVGAVEPGCRVEPASPWAPAGYVCPPRYGIGTASTWQGPGAARNDCEWPWTRCAPITIRSLTTGVQVIVTPRMYCHCWVGVTGPNGETERLVDLSPDLVAALGLPGPGLYPVEVLPAPGWTDVAMADTSTAP